MFTYEDNEDPEEREYYCTICKGRLEYLGDLNEWFCTICNQYYDTKIQDKPLKNKSGFKLHSHHDPYRQYDEEDPYIPFIKGVDVEDVAGDVEEVELVKSSPDRRVQTIRVRGSLAEALNATRET